MHWVISYYTSQEQVIQKEAENVECLVFFPLKFLSKLSYSILLVKQLIQN